jgi:hypothetical protein
MVQRELDRIVRDAPDRELLLAVMESVGNDPAVLADCLARPALVRRLLANRLTRVSTACPTAKPRGLQRPRSARALETAAPAPDPTSPYRNQPKLEIQAARLPAGFASNGTTDAPWSSEPDLHNGAAANGLNWSDWWRDHAKNYTVSADPAPLQAFPYTLTKDSNPWACLDKWTPMVAPSGRFDMAAAMTDRGLFVWGGWTARGLVYTYGVYDPTIDGWTNYTYTPDALPPRLCSRAVWSGREVLIFGGMDDQYVYGVGACFDPSSGAWRPMSPVNAPSPRIFSTVVWTGSAMIVWGGYNGSYLNDGAAYDPRTDTWTPIATPSFLAPRAHHTTVWTGSKMIVWGGYHGMASGCYGVSYSTDYEDSGGIYDPSHDAWAPTSVGPGTPSARAVHSAVWTGSRMMVLGGLRPLPGPGPSPTPETCASQPVLLVPPSFTMLSTGATYDPLTDAWSPMAPEPPNPPGTMPQQYIEGSVVWTGSELITWSGYGDQENLAHGNGAIYSPSADAWTPMVVTADTPPSRFSQATFWLGHEMLIWSGGYSGGAFYDPATGAWRPTADAIPKFYSPETATADTGVELIAFGGYGAQPDSHLLMKYDYLLDEWIPLSAAGAPKGYLSPCSVWTGSRFIVWSGAQQTDGLRSSLASEGASYDPSTDTWSPISSDGAPDPRQQGGAVWTGKEMIVWGGTGEFGLTHQGGRYDPVSDTWTPISNISLFQGYATPVKLFVWDPRLNKAILFPYTDRYLMFDPTADQWSSYLVAPGCFGSLLWNGDKIFSWGNVPDSQSQPWYFDPFANTWHSIPLAGAPSPQYEPSLGWIGSSLIAMTGYYASSQTGRYTPASDAWGFMSLQGSDLAWRSGAVTAPLGHDRLLLWGGWASSYPFRQDGAIYAPPTTTPVPTCASAPIPSDFETNLAPPQAVAWTATGAQSSFDVYFGTTQFPPYLGTTTGTSYPLPPTRMGTTYYWQVVARNACNPAIECRTWRFTTCDVPGRASPAFPTDGAAGVLGNTDLLWNWVDGATSYDLYLGRTPDPPFVANVQSPAYSHPPDALRADTTYYWKVVPVNPCGRPADCPVWSFTTCGPGPTCIADPLPADGSSDAPCDTRLNWSPVQGASQYDVFFGTSQDPPLAATIPSEASFLPGTLLGGTTYFWKVVPVDRCGTPSDCPLMSFKTGAPPRIAAVKKSASPFRLVVQGEAFHPNAWVFIDGAPVPSLSYKGTGKLVAGGGSALKALVPLGRPVSVVVKNGDGGVSDAFPFQR